MFGLRDTVGVKFETINVPPEVTAARLPGAGARFARRLDELRHVANWAVALKADAEGSVRPSLLFGDYVRYDLTRGDLERLRSGMRTLAEMHFAAGAREVITGIAGLPETIRSRDELAALRRRAARPARLQPGDDPPVRRLPRGQRRLDERRRSDAAVHGVEGLYVMDASVFPTNTGVNPQHSIMSVATVAAARLA